ncbi:MAG: thiamine diphosphokinase [Syntrophales bacterium]|nr:thiamine diphosphokinase [Syntrophales bacterium]
MNKKEKKKIACIIAGGALTDLHFVLSCIQQLNPSVIICADGGVKHAFRMGIKPHLAVGDLDSIDEATMRDLVECNCKIIKHPEKKDEADSMLALEEAIKLTPHEIVIFGATGYRIDHTLANLSLLLKGNKAGITVRIIDEWCEIFLVDDKYTLKGQVGQTVSILPFPGRATGITLQGFEYPLKNAKMYPLKPYGISNRLIREKATIKVEKGKLLVIRFHRPGRFPGGENSEC